MSPAAEEVIDKLDAARQKWWFFTLLTTAVLGTSASLGTMLLFMLGDAMFKFPQLVLLSLFSAWALVTLFLIVLLFRRLIGSQRSLEATARRVEAEFPQLGSNLINVVQLSGDTHNESHEFCRAAVDQAAARVGQINFGDAAKQKSRWARFRHCMQTPRDFSESIVLLILLVGAAIACQIMIPNWGSAAGRLMTPWEFVPSIGSVGEINVMPGNTEVLIGASLEVVGRISNPEGTSYDGKLFVTPEGEAETEFLMAADEKNGRFVRQIPPIVKPFTYRLEIGDSQTDLYAVGIREKPTIAEVEVTLHHPLYLKRPDETIIQKHADLEAPQYTVAELKIRPSVPIVGGEIHSDGQTFTGQVEHGGELLAVKLPMLKNTTFTVHMSKSAGHSDPAPRVNRITVLPDGRPEIELLKPPRQGSASPGSGVPVMIRAKDGHGLSGVILETKKKLESETAESAPKAPDTARAVIEKTWTEFDGKNTVVLHHRLELDDHRFGPGDTILVRAVARDTRNFGDYGLDLKPQEAASGWHAIRLVDREAESSAVIEQLDSLRGAIWKILETQVEGRVKAAMILHKQEAAEAATLAGHVRAKQVDVQKSSINLVKSIGASQEEERQAIKRVLNQLAFGEMLDAVKTCDELVNVTAPAEYAGPIPQLNATQDRIIEVLRMMLDVARQAQAEELAEMQTRPGGDLPDDVQDKLREAQDKLAEFLEQQKKVIEATENLAKKPVEDFTEEDEQLLKTLAATENDWSKFLMDLHSDLSKLPEQDFANASMLTELNEVQTEIKMAEDALLAKTADIAVPLEQLGAEMAEEIQTNIEKWLPDTPDRQRWSQEESLTDEGKEAPMAELPGELEDLIGELLEEEEDLFDEMEDVSSSAADSLDKGAGWEASDGPISNMSAKGVTGNRLPNTSEIGGRAGEGRSGKSSGEFVGNEAVGKGGRKTPSRLTPDPFMTGQIKDHSEDSQGGASGGGKESGEGGEGLEGPGARPSGDRDLHRLAGKQAALRNKAEGVDIQHFQVTGYHHTDLEKMIDLMAQIERDLKAGRYQNAMRQRKLLSDGLGNVKQYLQGEFEIQQDNTVNLPGDIQKEILGSMQDPSPVGWEALNRQYFERLAAGGQTIESEQSEPTAEPTEDAMPVPTFEVQTPKLPLEAPTFESR